VTGNLANEANDIFQNYFYRTSLADGEMLPAHGYPELRKHKHLVGNYGGAWQDQAKEFDAFPGAILMTTNCMQKPRDSYNARLFTTGLVAMPGVKLVRAEVRRNSSHAAAPGNQEHPAGPKPPGVRHSRRAGHTGADVQHRAHIHSRAGYEGDTPLRS